MAAAFFAVTAWCQSGLAPKIVTQPYDQIAVALFDHDPETRCFTRLPEPVPEGVSPITVVPSRDCYAFDPPRVFEGIYFDEFEGQELLEGLKPNARYQRLTPRTWVGFDKKSVRGRLTQSQGETQVWYVRFIGIKTSRPGHYGHMGASCAEIVVDRVVFAQPLQRGPGYLSQELIKSDRDPYDCKAWQ